MERKAGWIPPLLMLTSVWKCFDACAYPKPKKIAALRGITQCLTAESPINLQSLRTQCSWQISSNHSDYVIRVTVEEVSLPAYVEGRPSSCLFRHVIILDGNHIDADSLGNWCGTAKQTYTTSGQHAYIYFRSDKMVEATRFKICYKAIKLAKGSIEEENGVSAYGMFGYIVLGWVVLLVALKLTWDRVKKLKTAIHREAGSTETNYLERTGQRIDLSIISVAPPPYDNGPEYPNEAPPPYSPSRRSHSNDVAGSCHRIVLDNFILRSAPPPAYSPSQLPEVDRNTTPVSTNCTELCDGRSQNETISAMRASSGDR